MKVWIVIAVVAALNYLSRLSFIAFFARRQVPPLMARALRFVPAAMMTALIMPMILAPGGDNAGEAPLRAVAALVAAGVAWLTRSVLGTIGAGMAALWALKALA